MFEPSDRINCPARHAVHCPDSGGTTQSSHAELLGALGPRRVDTGPPEIVDVTPADGSVFTVNDVVLVGARVVEDGTFVGARWTWLGGLPEELPFGHDRCTNGVCADDFGSDGDPDADYEYLLLVGPPVGQYVFAFEVMDSAGQEASTTVSFRVVAPPPPPMPWPPTPPDDDEPDEPPPPRSDPFDDDDALPLDYGDDASEALGCRSGGGPPSPWAGWWLLAVARGRRAIRRRGRADDPPRRG
jgi:hypothetical protein